MYCTLLHPGHTLPRYLSELHAKHLPSSGSPFRLYPPRGKRLPLEGRLGYWGGRLSNDHSEGGGEGVVAASGLGSQLPPKGWGERPAHCVFRGRRTEASVFVLSSPVKLPLLHGGQRRSFLTGSSRLAPRRPPFEA